MSFLARFLGSGSKSNAGSEPRSMQPLLTALSEMEPERARYLAAFAYVMSRVAAADRIIDPAEVDQMRRSLIDEGGLPTEQAELVVSLATAVSAMVRQLDCTGAACASLHGVYTSYTPGPEAGSKTN